MENIRELKPEDLAKVSGGAAGAPGAEAHVRNLAINYKNNNTPKEEAIRSISASVKMIAYGSIVSIVSEVYGY